MKVAVVAPYGAWPYHFETDLELAQRHLLEGDAVTILVCHGDLQACDINIDHSPSQCINCISRRRRALQTLFGQVITDSLIRLNAEDRRALASIRTDFEGIEDLRSYRFRAFDLGMAVFSSIVSLRRDPQPSLETEASRVRRLCVSSAAVYLSVNRHLRSCSFDRVYAFNGRFAPMRAVLRACQDRGVDCFLHDRGSGIDRYALYENELPHNVATQEKMIRETWRKADNDSSRHEIAREYYESRARGISRNWVSFVANQEQGKLPASLDRKRHNIVVFTSSEDEFVAIGDQWQNPIYKNQTEGIQRISGDLQRFAETDCFIRLHPNLRGLANESVSAVLHVHAGNVHVISPDSPVSSYALLNVADKVVTFGSSMGIEATYWDKPSVLAGQSFYRNLGSTYNPNSHQDLMRMLMDDLKPADKLGAKMYGYFFATFGLPYKYFKAENLVDGRFNEKRVAPGPIMYRILVGLGSPVGTLPTWFLTRAFKTWASWRLRRARREA